MEFKNHLDRLLNSTVVEWNKWRQVAFDVPISLSKADLAGKYLRGRNLSGADLSGADLSGADLSGADLSGADLSKANLIGADLRGAVIEHKFHSISSLPGLSEGDAVLFGEKTNFAGALLMEAFVYDTPTNRGVISESMHDYILWKVEKFHLRTSASQPLTLAFDLDAFSEDEIAEIITGLSSIYTSIGGDCLEIDAQEIAVFAEVPMFVTL